MRNNPDHVESLKYDVSTNKGWSGGDIIQLKDGKYICAGIHTGILGEYNRGIVFTPNLLSQINE